MTKKTNEGNYPSQDSDSSPRSVTLYGHCGPLPPPKTLADYEAVVPGSADRIITLAENQQLHRQQLEKQVISAEIRNSLLGLVFGFIIGALTVIGGVYVASLGIAGGYWISGSGLAALAGVFVYGSRERRKERETKFNILTKRP